MAAELRSLFLVDSGRYPSVFDVVRDIHGITCVRRATTTLASVGSVIDGLRGGLSSPG
jgi:hypothetical protein